MPAWLEIILNILLFILCLSSLILVHEAGHLAAAKIFNVYCADFSIGFGKAFFSKKRKGGETSFSLRIFPLGGFVAMAGEEGEVEEGLDIPKERTIAGVAKWKAAIVMSAGVFVNIIVSILLLYASNQFFLTEIIYSDALETRPDSIAEKAGLKTFNPKTQEGNFLQMAGDPRKEAETFKYYSYDSVATFSDNSTRPIIAGIDMGSMSLKHHDFDSHLRFFEKTTTEIKDDDNGLTYKMSVANFNKEIKPDTTINKLDESEKNKSNFSETDDSPKIETITLNLHAYVPASEDEAEGSYFCTGCGKMITNMDEIEVVETQKGDEIKKTYFHVGCKCHTFEAFASKDIESVNGETSKLEGVKKSLVIHGAKTDNVKPLYINVKPNADGELAFEEIGLSLYKHSYWQNFNQAWSNTFKQFGQGSAMIFTTLGKLFIGQGWDQVGSIISIYNQQSMIMDSFGPQTLIYYWGLISVNLAIFNLLPLPGLDGWQLLVITIEGITKKKIPDKVKTIVSYVGLGLIFVLMGVLIIKDIIGLF